MGTNKNPWKKTKDNKWRGSVWSNGQLPAQRWQVKSEQQMCHAVVKNSMMESNQDTAVKSDAKEKEEIVSKKVHSKNSHKSKPRTFQERIANIDLSKRSRVEKLGVVVEGGGMRGIYAAGVLDVLQEHRLMPDGLIGVSAGAIHGASFVANQPGRSIRYYKKYAADPRFMSFQSLIKTGDIVGREFCYEELPNRLDPMDYDTFNDNAKQLEYYATASNIETGEPEYLRVTKLPEQMDAVRASASLPYVSRIVEYEGKRLLDGGMADSIPIRAFRKLGFTRNIVILTREDHYHKKPEKWQIARIAYRKYPAFVETVKKRHEVYNKTLKDIKAYEKDGSVFVLQPSEPLRIGRMSHDASEIERVYQVGRCNAENRLAELKEWLDILI